MIRRTGLAFAILCLTAICAQAEPMPAGAETMIRAAAAKGDASLSATAAIARKSFPKSAKEIDRLVKTLHTLEAQRHRVRLLHQGLLQGWKGSVQIGAANSTGNTRSTGFHFAAAAKREGLAWTHAAAASVDYERVNGAETKGRYFASYQANYTFDDRLYLLGLVSWEDNRFAGFTDRRSEGLGFGYALIREPDLKLSLEGGPALRQTDYVHDGKVDSFAPRAAVHYDWAIMPNVHFTQDTSYFSENRDSTVTADTGLRVGMSGNLSLQASYLAQYESDPAGTVGRFNGTTRLTLNCAF
jgi:putative salt-induced outer membrane protein